MKNRLSSKRLYRLRVQGYQNYSDFDLSQLAFGNRFAFIICSSLVLIGVVTANIPLLSIMMMVALFGFLLPYHPFDYIYNTIISGVLNRPKLPRRSKQLKFACIMATLFLAATITLFYLGITTIGYIVGGMLLLVAILVSTIDYCIPSYIYNALFKYEVK